MTAPPAPRLRLMTPADLDAVLGIQLACYGAGFVEDGALVARRLQAAPGTHWVAEHQGAPQAYLAAYPSRRGVLTALHGDFHVAPRPDTLYLHDLAVHPDAGGARLGPALVSHALAQAAACHWPNAALVAVQGSAGFWARFGFAAQPVPDEAARARLAGYPGAAQYMVRTASPG